jgi:signal transduction histidine kinase
MRRLFHISAGRDGASWPVLLLLVTALAPSAGVVWMMRAALESEQLAVRQRLADAYRVQLEASKHGVEEFWETRLAELQKTGEELPPPEAFKRGVMEGRVDSLIVRDETGKTLYPDAATPSSLAAPENPEWQQAERLEFANRNPAAAAEAYRVLAEQANDLQLRALAEQGRARCLLRLGETDAAIAVLDKLKLRDGVTDRHGRLIAADAVVRLLELSKRNSHAWRDAARRLQARLSNYSNSALPAEQRRFLMHRATELGVENGFVTLAAEDLAAAFLADSGKSNDRPGLRPTPISGVWSIATPNRQVVALYRTKTLETHLRKLLSEQFLPAGVTIDVRAPGQSEGSGDDLLTTSLGPVLPGWRLAMATTGAQVLDQAASDRRVSLLSIATILVGVTLTATAFVAFGVRRQMQVARLKNDLVATVSHELKTPLASIRLLVDTLLEADASEGAASSINGNAREYLAMIAHENARLSRLIDNFLTFSRMERGKHHFESEPVDVGDVIERATAAVADRFNGEHVHLRVSVEKALWVRGDADALVTALINLLDNAWKYGGHQGVDVRGRYSGGLVTIEVEDHGVGLAPRAARRVFERFYQVDQQLSRSQGGCGLGLSIVKYIIEAQGGAASVSSRIDEGSIFTLSLPALAQGDGSDVPDRTALKGAVPAPEHAS